MTGCRFGTQIARRPRDITLSHRHMMTWKDNLMLVAVTEQIPTLSTEMFIAPVSEDGMGRWQPRVVALSPDWQRRHGL